MTTQRANYLYPAIGMGLILSAIIFVVVLVPRWTFKPAQPKDLRNYTAQEQRGRTIYRREGCWYCHSMASRPQDWDHGVRSKASDYFWDMDGHLLGSERSGPDLANIGGKFPDEYHDQHHRQPRSLKPGSIMPSYDYLSKQEMTDVVAFLQGLGPNGTRALDIANGEMKWAFFTKTWNPDLPAVRTVPRSEVKPTDKILSEVNKDFVTIQGERSGWEWVANWKHSVKEREEIASANYDAHPETPYKYTAEIEEFMYGTSHEAQNAKTPLNALATKTFANEEELHHAREKDPNVAAWTEVSFKEPEVLPTDIVGLKALEARRVVANQGRGIYNQKCSACHGLDGNGRGWASASMTRRAANFWEDKFQSYKTDTWYWRISRGVPGTQMPRWELMSGHLGGLYPDQRLYLTAYLKYISQNKGLGKLAGTDAPNAGAPPSAATQPAAK